MAIQNGSRLVIWNSFPSPTDVDAEDVWGAASLTENSAVPLPSRSVYTPYSAIAVGGQMFVADGGGNRVLVWRSVPRDPNTPADFALGQPNDATNLTAFAPNNGGISGSSMSGPNHVASDGKNLLVVDAGNRRVLVWSQLPTQPTSADFALGQPDLLTGTSTSASASSFCYPTAVASNGNAVFVTDRNCNRVLGWTTFPNSSGAPADFALGQPAGPNNLTSSTRDAGGLSGSALDFPSDAEFVGNGLGVNDTDNRRTLLWASVPTAAQSADFALGQNDLTTYVRLPVSRQAEPGPISLAYDGHRLFVVDTQQGAGRVLVFNTVPTASATLPDAELGQPDFNTLSYPPVSATTFAYPNKIWADPTRLFVSDLQYMRVTVLPTAP